MLSAAAAELTSAEKKELFDAKLSLVFVTFVLTIIGSAAPWWIRRLRRSLELICESPPRLCCKLRLTLVVCCTCDQPSVRVLRPASFWVQASRICCQSQRYRLLLRWMHFACVRVVLRNLTPPLHCTFRTHGTSTFKVYLAQGPRNFPL